jgi:hypothetical protein
MTKVTKKEDNKLAVPAYLEGEIFDKDDIQFDQDDLGFTRIKLAQKYREDVCKPGEYIDDKTGANYGSEIEVIILKQEKEWVKFTKAEPYELVARSKTKGTWDYVVGKDGTEPMVDETLKDKDGKEYKMNEAKTCLQFTYTVLVANQSTSIPSLMSFKGRPSIDGAGRPLVGLISRFVEQDGLPIYAHRYKIKSASGQNETYFSVASSCDGFTSEQDAVRAKRAYEQLKKDELQAQEQVAIQEPKIDENVD